MNDQRKTKAQLLDELIELRQRVVQLDAINRQGMTSEQTSSIVRQAETDLKKVQGAAHVGHWTWDVQSNRVSWSDEMYRIFGLNPIGFSGDLDEVIRTAIHPDDRAKIDQANTAVSELGQPAPLEYRVVWSDGTVRTVYAEPAEQTRDEHGNVIRLWGIVQDITERRRAEEKVERQNRRLQILRDIDVAILAAESVEDIVGAALNHIRELVGCPRVSVTLFEWSTNELLIFEVSSDYARIPKGTRMPLTVLGDRLQTLRQNQPLLVHDFAELQVPSPSDLVLMSAGLRSACGLPLFVQNELIGALALVSDIPGFFDEEKIDLGREVANQLAIASTQHRLVEALHASEEQYRALFQNSLDAILLTSTVGSIQAANPAACKMLGRTEAEICALGRSGLVDTTDPRVAVLLAERARTGQAFGELTMFRRDGSPFPVEMSSALFKDQQGHLRSSMIIRDITARKQAEQDLRESEQLFSTIFKHSPIALSMVGVPGGKNLEVNEAWCTLTGYSRAEAIGHDTAELQIFDPEERNKLIAAFSNQGYSRLAESELTTKSGGKRNILITSELITIRERQLIIASVIDITERKQAEQKLRQSEELFSKAFHVSPAAITITRVGDGQFIDVNETFLRMFGFSREDAIGHTSTELNMLSLEERAKLMQAQREAGGLRNAELRARSKSGRLIHLLFSSAPIDVDGEAGLISTLIDITERKQAEKQIVQMKRLYATLSQVNQTIVRVKDRADLYRSICDVAVQFGEFSLAWIGLVDEASGDVKPVTANGLDVAQWPFQIVNIEQGALKDGLVATAIRTSKVVTSEDLGVDERTAALYPQALKYNYHSTAAIPFRLRGRTLGAVTLISSEVGLFKAEQEVRLLDEMGLDISFALDTLETEAERQRAEEQTRAHATRLKILADASQAFAAVGRDYQAVLDQVVRQVTEVLADMCQIRLLSDDGQLLKLAAIYSRDSELSQALHKIAHSISEHTDDPGMAPYVFRTGQPAFVPVITTDQLLASLPPEYEGIDLRFAPHSYIVVSLRVQGRSLGVMALTRYRTQPAFTADDVTLAQDLADRAALAISNAQLFQQVQNELTERKRAEARILRLNRLYATLSQINQTIVRARDRATLFREICRVAIEFGQFRLAWIGLIDEAEERVRPVAFAGEEQGYLTNVSVKYRDETLGRGPTGTAIREGRCVICQDIATNPLMTPWRDQALQRGYGSSAAVPIRQNTDVVGALTVYATEPDGFDADDERLLDEVGLDISFALDMLEQEVQRLRAEDALQSLNLELEQRVVRRTAELAAANERLTELDRLKSKFVSTVSHELRTPVTSLGLLVDLLEHGKPEKREQYLMRLKEQMTRLHTMINDILDLSRLERNASEADWATVDIGPMVEHVVAMQHVAAETAGLQLSSEVPAQPVWVRARPEHLLRAITNLIGNAIKYTRTGTVDVITYKEADRLCVQIKDTGLGIAPEDLLHLFERFYRGKQAVQSNIPGTGLGLSIVKEIVESHGGTVEVASELGVGSTFRLWLPVVTG